MRVNIIYSYYEMYYYWAVTTSYCLRKLGIESDVYCPHIKGSKRDLSNYVYPDADYYIIINDREYEIYNIPQSSKKIVWVMEQIDFSSELLQIKLNNGYVKNMQTKCDYFIASNQITADEAQMHDIDIHGVFGFCYDEILDSHMFGGHFKRDIPIYFCGGFNPLVTRRRNIIDRIKKNFSLTLDSGIYMDAYYKKMAMSKIVLNVHLYSLKDCKTSYGLFRIISSILQGGLIVSDNVVDTFPLSKECFVQCDQEDFEEACVYYLEHEDEREKIALNALNYIKKHYRMDDYLYKFIIENIDESFEKQDCEAEIPEVLL